MKNKILALFTFISFLTESQIDLQLKKHVCFLSSDSLKGRQTGSVEEKQVNNYLRSNFITSKKSKIQQWDYSFVKNTVTYQSQMIGCYVNNKCDITLLITAHVDHIGLGSNLSLSYKENEIHNGADDNASGVALMIELQRLLVQKKLKANILFIAYTGHELGLFGSKFFIENISKKYKKIVLNLNFDMIGRMDKSLTNVYVSASETLKSSFKSEFSNINLIEVDSTRLLSLDCSHFHLKGIPSATFTTGIHNDYHKTSDDEQYINYDGIMKILISTENWILKHYSN